MELLNQISQWIYPFAELTITICCFAYIRHVVGTLLGIAFGIKLFSSVIWKIMYFSTELLGYNFERIYDLISGVNMFLFLVSSGLIIVVVVKIGELVTSSNMMLTTSEKISSPPGSEGSSVSDNDLDGC